MAPLALVATTAACLAVMVKESLDAGAEDSCLASNTTGGGGTFEPRFPTDIDFWGFGEGDR